MDGIVHLKLYYSSFDRTYDKLKPKREQEIPEVKTVLIEHMIG